MSDYISKSEVMTILTDVELKEGTFTEAKSKIRDIPPVDEKEILRKPFERVVERLEMKQPTSWEYDAYWNGVKETLEEAIEIVKEEGGIE